MLAFGRRLGRKGTAGKGRNLPFFCVLLLLRPFSCKLFRFLSMSGGGEAIFFPPSDGGTPQPQANWSTLSITPQATWAAAASLIVPLAVFACVLQLGFQQRKALCWVMLGFGIVSLALGFLQIAQGPESVLRFYEFTNLTEAVGFFANRNHFAALLNVTLILSALWLAESVESSLGRGAAHTRAILWFAAAAVFLVAILVGLAMARSRAGIALAMAALIGIGFMALSPRGAGRAGEPRRDPRKGVGRVSLAVILLAVLFAVQVGLGSILSRFEDGVTDDLRIAFSRTTFETAIKALPFGTGLGSFVPVYAAVEKPDDLLWKASTAHIMILSRFFLKLALLGPLFSSFSSFGLAGDFTQFGFSPNLTKIPARQGLSAPRR